MTDINTLNNPNTALQANILTQIERLKALAEREQTPELATECQLIAEVIGEGFEQIATGETAPATETETLSESELWAKFVNSKVQLATRYGPTVGFTGVREFLDTGSTVRDEIEDMSDTVLGDYEDGFVIKSYIVELSAFVAHLETIRDTFESEKSGLLITDEDGDVPNGEYRYRVPDWEQA